MKGGRNAHGDATDLQDEQGTEVDERSGEEGGEQEVGIGGNGVPGGVSAGVDHTVGGFRVLGVWHQCQVTVQSCC